MAALTQSPEADMQLALYWFLKVAIPLWIIVEPLRIGWRMFGGMLR